MNKIKINLYLPVLNMLVNIRCDFSFTVISLNIQCQNMNIQSSHTVNVLLIKMYYLRQL